MRGRGEKWTDREARIGASIERILHHEPDNT